MRKSKRLRSSSGQALIETALILPLLLMIVLNAINFGYFFLTALNITSSSRTSGLYSVMGGATPSAIALPTAGPPTTACPATTVTSTVGDLALQDLCGAVFSPSTSGASSNTGIQVCSSTVGVLNPASATMQSKCTSYGIGSFSSAEPDPELSGGIPVFMLNRVDVAYQFSPPIPLAPFNILALATPACVSSGGKVTCTFYRHVEMREMN